MSFEMKLRTIFITSACVACLFLFTCALLYIHAGNKEWVSVDLLEKLSVVRSKGMTGLKMEWLKEIALVNTGKSQSENSLPVPQSPISTFGRVAHRLPNNISTGEIYNELKFEDLPGGVWKQGFPITCNKEELAKHPIEVFVVPHSHQDVGWIMSVDEYFHRMTKPGLDATLKVLLKRTEARFTYAEITYFSKWVEGLSVQSKQDVKCLLDSGRLELTSGGWVMSDEANVHHYAMMDQLIEGHRWLLDTFGYLPTTGWSIDPFGQSSTMAYFMRKMRFDGAVIHRVHYEVKKFLASRKLLEFYWKQPWDGTAQDQTITHMLPFYSYDVPHTCGPDPAICCQFDFWRTKRLTCPWKVPPKLITPDNVAVRAAMLGDQYCKHATLYPDSRLLLVPLGDDFRYLSEDEWNLQLDNYGKIFEYWDAHPELGVKAHFATVSDYFKALRSVLRNSAVSSSLEEFYPRIEGDFFAYADRVKDYWTGYFTSRPWQKSFSRHLQSELRAAEWLFSYARRYLSLKPTTSAFLPSIDSLYDKLSSARRTLGILQHHDAITGTAKPDVVHDYSTRMLTAITHVRSVSCISLATVLLLRSPQSSNPSPDTSDFATRVDQLRTLLSQPNNTGWVDSLEDSWVVHGLPNPKLIDLAGNGASDTLYIFNPIPHGRNMSTTVALSSDAKSLFASQVIVDKETGALTERSLTLQIELQSESTPYTKVRIGPIEMEPMSLNRIHLKLLPGVDNNAVSPVAVIHDATSSDSIYLRTGTVELEFDRRSGLLKHFTDLHYGLELDVMIDFVVYESQKSESNSGAYLFVPKGPATVMQIPDNPKIQITEGALSKEITLITPLVTHTVRLYNYDRYPSGTIEIENTANLHSQTDMELVMRVRTNIAPTNGTFYTDSNCYQFIRRRYYSKIPIQGNVYPLTCAAYIEGPSESPLRVSTLPSSPVRLTLLTAHAVGVTSIEPGELSVWIDRRTPKDDNRGVGSPLLGKWSVKSLFNFIIEPVNSVEEAIPGIIHSLTIDAHAALMNLIQPPLRFLINTNRAAFMAPSLNLMPNFIPPCGYDLVVLKTFLQSTDNNSPEMRKSSNTQLGLWVRRMVLSEQSNWSLNSSSFCRYSKGIEHEEINIPKVFALVNLRRAAQTHRVTMILEPGEHLNWLESVRVNPMELEAFILQ